MSGAHLLLDDPLLEAVFKKLRTIGHERTDGETIHVEGGEYGITAHATCTLQLVHVVTEKLNGPSSGQQSAMVFLEVKNNGYHGVDGAAHLMPALINGLVLADPMRPDRHSWRVLRRVEVPSCFAPGVDESSD